VISEIALRIGEAWLLCALIQAILWLIAQNTKNAGVVDVGWALSFTAVIGLFGLTTTAPKHGWFPIACVVVAWSTRLGCYLIARGAATGPEEGRYVDLRRRWALHASGRFFVFFQAQAALTAILATAFVVPFVEPPIDSLRWLRAVGLLLCVVGVIGETAADAQLAKWKRDPNNRGRVCTAGLWAYSRHPNYFFEWLVWLGYAVFALGFHGGWIALGGQALIFATIWKVTGIPATEAQALRSKGEAYRDYQKRVSRFIPLPPKSRASDT
jgi:steroid 5-alpha reductase family enzyme